MTRRWTLGFSLMLCLGLVACSGDDDDGGTTTGDTGVADTSTADTASSDTSPGETADTATPTDTAKADGDATVVTSGTMDIQILNVSDWHGEVDPIAESDSHGVSQTYGGLGYLSTYLAKDRAANPNSLFFTAGDVMGASQTLSSVFEDKPAIEGMNFLKLDGDTFGNHDFDRTTAVLKKRMSEAKFKFISSNLTNTETELDDTTIGSKVEKPYFLYTLGGGTDPTKQVTVGVIGITNPDAPSLIFPGLLKTITIKEPIAAANAAATAARAAGANVVIALVHMGATGVDTAGAAVGPLIDFAKGISGIDLVLGDHTDQIVNVKIGDVRVTENRSKGRTYGRTIIKVAAGKVTDVAATIVEPAAVDTAFLTGCTAPADCESGVCTAGKCVAKACTIGTSTCSTSASCGDCKAGICTVASGATTGTCSLGCSASAPCPTVATGPAYTCTAGTCSRKMVDPDPAAETLLKPYRDSLHVEFDKTVGVASDVFPRNGTVERLGEVAQGDLIAAALLDRYKTSDGAQIAFTNAGGIRSPLPSSYLPDASLTTLRRTTGAPFAAGPPYDLLVGDIYNTLPFGNVCVVRKISGDLLWQVLERSVSSAGTTPTTYGGFLQIAGFKFSYSAGAAVGSRVESVTLLDGSSGGAGKPIPKGDATLYVLVTNDFTNAGGDGYTMLKETVPTAGRDVMAEVLLGYIKAKTPVSPTITGLITRDP